MCLRLGVPVGPPTHASRHGKTRHRLVYDVVEHLLNTDGISLLRYKCLYDKTMSYTTARMHELYSWFVACCLVQALLM